MICPLDQEPCTGDHSMRCYTECSRARGQQIMDQPGPYTHTVDPDPQGLWMTVHTGQTGKPNPKRRRPSVIAGFIHRLTWKDWVIIWSCIIGFGVGRATAHYLADKYWGEDDKIINCTRTDETYYRCTIETVAP